MHPSLLLLICLLSVSSLAQSVDPSPRADRSKPVTYSASSDWQQITLKPATRTGNSSLAGASSPQPGRGRSPVEAAPATRPDAARPDAARPSVAVTEPARQPERTNVPITPPLRTDRPVPPPNRPAEPVVRTNPATASTPGISGYRPAFTGDFVTNRTGWKAGNRGDYHYQIGLGRYNIRKRNPSTRQAAFSYVALPSDINLNIAETFTARVDVVADSGRIPTGGLLFGVRDSLNYCAFTLNDQGEISISRLVNGQPGDDMPGDYFTPGVPVDRNRNRLTVRRRGAALHFYINEREVRSSPYPLQSFSGNGIGMTTTGQWTSFQKLSVTLGL